MILGSKGKSRFNERSEKIVNSILKEEGLELNDDTLVSSVMAKYGSIDPNHAKQLEFLYDGSWSFRRTAAAVVEGYYRHPQPEIFNLVPLIKFLSKHLDGIPFMDEWNPEKSGDYDPTRAAHFLDAEYKLFGSYQREGEQIDYLHSEAKKELYPYPKGDNHESRIITNHQLYNLYINGWFKKQEDKIAKIILSKDLTPSIALNVLAENWEWYVTPTAFRNMTHDIEYCIYCAEEFPDNPEARKEFRKVVMAIHNPN